jgi:valyl-tRNA synthetase
MIDRYGADALRFTLGAGTVPGRDMSLPEAAIEGNRNFINKIWNATRFALGHSERLGAPAPLAEVTPGRFERWIVGRLYQVAGEARDYLEQRRFNEACRVLYGFVWHEFCDWYLEITKPALAGALGEGPQAAALATLHHVLGGALRLLHPFMPFVTEELASHLPGTPGPIIVQPYPRGADLGALGGAWKGKKNEKLMQQEQMHAQFVITLIECIRTVRGEQGIRPNQKVDLIINHHDPFLGAVFNESSTIIITLGGIRNIEFAGKHIPDGVGSKYVDAHIRKPGEAYGVGHGFEVFLSLAGAIDVESERQRLGREVDKTRTRIDQLNHKLENPAFRDKAPAAVVDKSRAELTSLEAQLAKLRESLGQLGGG